MRALRDALTCFLWGHKPPYYAQPWGPVFCRRCKQPIRYGFSTHR